MTELYTPGQLLDAHIDVIIPDPGQIVFETNFENPITSGLEFQVLTGLGNTALDFLKFQNAIFTASLQNKIVYIPSNEHLKLIDFPIFPDNAKLINDGIYENVTINENYAFQSCLFGLGRITQSDFWPDPNTIGTVGSVFDYGDPEVVNNRIILSSVTNIGWITSYASKTGIKETRVFVNNGEGNPAASVAYLSAIGNNGSDYYIDLEDENGDPIAATVVTNDTIDLMDTILVNTGFLNQQGVNVFKLNPTRRGNRVVLTTPSESSNFEVGEKVFLKTAGHYIARYPTDRAFTPYYSHVDIIESITEGVITLKIGVHDLGDKLTDLELCKFENLRKNLTTHPSGGISAHAVKNVYIGGNGKFIQHTNKSIIAFAGGCMIDCTIDINEVYGGGFTTNSFCRSTAKIKKLSSFSTIVSLALGSCDFNVEIETPRLIKNNSDASSKTSRSIIFPHENIVNGVIKTGVITTSYDYALAINILELDCLRVTIDYAFEINKNEQVETPSFGNCIQLRSQDPQLLGNARGYQGNNIINQRSSSSPYFAQLLGIDDAINNYEELPNIYNIVYTGAFGEGVIIGDYRNNHNIFLNVKRLIRKLTVSNLQSTYTLENGYKTLVTFSEGDTKQFSDGQFVSFKDVQGTGWSDLNSGTKQITRIVNDTQIEINVDSHTYFTYSPAGTPIMLGAEGISYYNDSVFSYNNKTEGYIDNKVDTAMTGLLITNRGNNVVNIEDAKNRVLKSKVKRANLANSNNLNNSGNYIERPNSGYIATTSGKVFVVGVTPGGDDILEYPSLQTTKFFLPVRLTSSSCLLSSNGQNILKIGDTFKKVITGKIYGSYSGVKTIMDTYRWFDTANGQVNMVFATEITGGQFFTITSYLQFTSGTHVKTWSIFDDGVLIQRQDHSKIIGVPQATFNNHLVAYFDASFAPDLPLGNSWQNYDDVIAYEALFQGEAFNNNTYDRIVIESVEVFYERNY